MVRWGIAGRLVVPWIWLLCGTCHLAAADLPKVDVSVQVGHTQAITSIAFLPDAARVVTASNDGSLRLWETGSGREVRVFRGHVGAVKWISISPDGLSIASVDSLGVIMVWDATSGKVVRRIATEDTYIVALHYTKDGERLLGASNKVSAWDVNTGKLLNQSRLVPAMPIAAAFSRDGRYVALALFEGIVVGETETAKVLWTVKEHKARSIVFSPDDRLVVSGSSNGVIDLWDTRSGAHVTSHGEPDEHNEINAIAADGPQVISVVDRVHIVVREMASGHIIRTFKGFGPLAVSGDRRLLASGVISQDIVEGVQTCSICEAQIIDLQHTGQQVPLILRGYTLPVAGAGFGPQGRGFFAGAAFGTAQAVRAANAGVDMLDLQSGRFVRHFPGMMEIAAGGFTPDGRALVAVASGSVFDSDAAELMRWDPESGSVLGAADLGSSDLPYRKVAAFSQDRHQLATTEADGAVKVWDVRAGTTRIVLQGYRDIRSTFDLGNSGKVLSLAFSADGQLLASSGSGEWGLRIWNTKTGRLVRTIGGPQNAALVRGIAISPDGRLIASAERGGLGASVGPALRIWDRTSGRLVKVLSRQGEADKVVFSHDGRYLLAGYLDGTMTLWEVVAGKEDRTFTGHEGWTIASIEFSADDKLILSGAEDGTARLWSVRTGEELVKFLKFVGGEWIVITPEGYFNGSHGGPDHVNFRLGNTLYPANQFYDVFYRPDIVQRKIQGEDIGPLATISAAEALKNPPPQVTYLTTPADSDELKATVRFRVASAGGGIGEVRVFHNGKLAQLDMEYKFLHAAPSGATLAAVTPSMIEGQLKEAARGLILPEAVSGSLPTPAVAAVRPTRQAIVRGEVYETAVEIETVSGDNEVSVVAFNREGTVHSQVASVRFRSTRAAEAARLFVLAIGIDEFRDTRVRLAYAAKDAVDFTVRFSTQAATLIPSDQSRLVTVIRNDQATKKNILAALEDVARGTRGGDRFVFFVASHGVFDQGTYSIVTHDYDGALRSDNLISAAELLQASTRIKALTQLYILDTCHAGGIDTLVSGLYDARMTVLARNMGLYVYASASAVQEALDGYQGNGLFTNSLLAGLPSGEADANKDKMVTVAELGEFVRRRVVTIAKDIGHRQSPLIINFGVDSPIYALH